MNRSEKFWRTQTDWMADFEDLEESRSQRYDAVRKYYVPSNQLLPCASYWGGEGRHQALADRLETLMPASGRVKNPRKNRHLEHFRVVSNAYYDLYNNGGGNRPSQIYTYAGKRGVNDRYVYVALEFYIDHVILQAYAEQFGLDAAIEHGIFLEEIPEAVG